MVDGVGQRAKVQRCGLAVAGSGILCRSNNATLGVHDVERELVGIHVTPAEGLGCADGRSTRGGVGVVERDVLAGAVLDGPRHLEGVGVGVGRHRCHQCVGVGVVGVAVSAGVGLGQSVLVGANLAKRNVAKAHRAVCRVGRRCRSRRRCAVKRCERERELPGRQVGRVEGLVDGDAAITGRAGLNRRELVGVGHGVLGVALVHAARDSVSRGGTSAACGHGREDPASRRGLLVNRIRSANGKVLEEDALPCREGKGRGLTACKRALGVADCVGDARAIRSGHGDVKVEAGVRGVRAVIGRGNLCNLDLALEGVGSGYGSGPVIGVVGHAIHHHGGEGLVAQLVAGVDGRLGEGHLATGSKHLAVGLDAVRHVYLGPVVIVGVERHRGELFAVKEHAERDVTGRTIDRVVKRVDPFLTNGDGGSVHGHGVGVGKGHAASIGFSRYIQTRGLLGIGKAGGGRGPGTVSLRHGISWQHVGGRSARLVVGHVGRSVGLYPISTSGRIIDNVCGQAGGSSCVLQTGYLSDGFLARPDLEAHGIRDTMLQRAKRGEVPSHVLVCLVICSRGSIEPVARLAVLGLGVRKGVSRPLQGSGSKRRDAVGHLDVAVREVVRDGVDDVVEGSIKGGAVGSVVVVARLASSGSEVLHVGNGAKGANGKERLALTGYGNGLVPGVVVVKAIGVGVAGAIVGVAIRVMTFKLIPVLPPSLRSPRFAEGWVAIGNKDDVDIGAVTRLNCVGGRQRVFPVSATSGSEAVYLLLEAREARRARDARSCVV